MTVTEQLKQASSREIGQITSHPWLTAAADGVLQDHQVGAWAAQDLLWGAWYGEVMPRCPQTSPAVGAGGVRLARRQHGPGAGLAAWPGGR